MTSGHRRRIMMNVAHLCKVVEMADSRTVYLDCAARLRERRAMYCTFQYCSSRDGVLAIRISFFWQASETLTQDWRSSWFRTVQGN